MSYFTKLHHYMVHVEDHSHSTVNDRKKMPPSRKCEIFVHYVFVQLGGKDRSSRVRYYHHHAWNARIAYGEKGKIWVSILWGCLKFIFC